MIKNLLSWPDVIIYKTFVENLRRHKY